MLYRLFKTFCTCAEVANRCVPFQLDPLPWLAGEASHRRWQLAAAHTASDTEDRGDILGIVAERTPRWLRPGSPRNADAQILCVTERPDGAKETLTSLT